MLNRVNHRVNAINPAALVSTILYLLFRFLCYRLVAVRFGLVVPAKLIGKMWFLCQESDREDRLQNDLLCIGQDAKTLL